MWIVSYDFVCYLDAYNRRLIPMPNERYLTKTAEFSQLPREFVKAAKGTYDRYDHMTLRETTPLLVQFEGFLRADYPLWTSRWSKRTIDWMIDADPQLCSDIRALRNETVPSLWWSLLLIMFLSSLPLYLFWEEFSFQTEFPVELLSFKQRADYDITGSLAKSYENPPRSISDQFYRKLRWFVGVSLLAERGAIGERTLILSGFNKALDVSFGIYKKVFFLLSDFCFHSNLFSNFKNNGKYLCLRFNSTIISQGMKGWKVLFLSTDLASRLRRLFFCSYCTYSSQNRHNVVRHERSHTGTSVCLWVSGVDEIVLSPSEVASSSKPPQ